MKRCLTILIIICSLFNKVYGQSPKAAIDSLVKYKIITGKERIVLEQGLKEHNGQASYRVVILGGLENIMMHKIFHINPRRTGSLWYASSTKYFKEKNQDSINTSLHVLLDKIKGAGLLTDKIYNYALQDIDTGRYVADMQMIGQLSEMSLRLEWLAPRRLLPVVEQLHNHSIVSDSSFVRLENDIREGEIESSTQLIEYCKLSRTFDMSKYAGDPGAWFEQIHRDVASILPGLNFTDFSYSAINDTTFSSGHLSAIKYRISLKCNGLIYKHTTISSFLINNGTKVISDEFSPEDICRIFNKILIDQQSPFRLHHVTFTPPGNDDYLKSGVIALRDTQAMVFWKKPCLSFMLVSLDNYNNDLTSAKIDSALMEWKNIGLFAHLSDAEINKAVDDVKGDDIFSMDRLLFDFPNVIYSMDAALRSPHLQHGDLPYGNLLRNIAKITHGAFKPTRITQSKVDKGVKLQYVFEGKIHSHIFKTNYGWFDTGFAAFVKHLNEENNLPGKFYQLHYEEAFIYLTQQQHDYAIEHRLLDVARATKVSR